MAEVWKIGDLRRHLFMYMDSHVLIKIIGFICKTWRKEAWEILKKYRTKTLFFDSEAILYYEHTHTGELMSTVIHECPAIRLEKSWIPLGPYKIYEIRGRKRRRCLRAVFKLERGNIIKQNTYYCNGKRNDLKAKVSMIVVYHFNNPWYRETCLLNRNDNFFKSFADFWRREI